MWVKGVCLVLVAVNDDNGVIVKRFSGTRLNTRVYASNVLIIHRYPIQCLYVIISLRFHEQKRTFYYLYTVCDDTIE